MNAIFRIAAGSLTLSILGAVAWGSVFFTVDVGGLRDENGDPLIQEGMLYLVSSTDDDNFTLPTAGALVGDDDEIVASWDLSQEPSTGGEYIVSSGALSFQETWEAGNDLAILWFPNLTLANQVPADGEPYGFYRNTSASGDGDVWEMPENGALLHSLKFFIDVESPLVGMGDVPAIVAAAGLGAGDTAGPPTGPSSVATNENDPGTVRFEWSGADAPGGGFRIERRLAGGSDWTILGTTDGSATSWDDDTVGRGKDYEYRLIAVNGFDAVSSAGANIQSLRSSLANISTRGVLGSGDQVLILGFTVVGSGDIELLTRVQGPELDLPDHLTTAGDPTSLMVDSSFDTVASNDDWASDQLAEIQNLFSPRTFALPNSDVNSKDSAIAATLNGTGLFTVVSSDLESTGGLALVEVFDATEALPNDALNRMTNLSTRGFVGAGDEILIGGFAVKGQVDSKLLIRGVGPSLAEENFGGLDAGSVLPDSRLMLFDQFGAPVAENDDWETQQGEGVSTPEEILAVSSAVGANNFATGSKDAALLVSLDPGLYTFFMLGADSETGIGLIEVFLAD